MRQSTPRLAGPPVGMHHAGTVVTGRRGCAAGGSALMVRGRLPRCSSRRRLRLRRGGVPGTRSRSRSWTTVPSMYNCPPSPGGRVARVGTGISHLEWCIRRGLRGSSWLAAALGCAQVSAMTAACGAIQRASHGWRWWPRTVRRPRRRWLVCACVDRLRMGGSVAGPRLRIRQHLPRPHPPACDRHPPPRQPSRGPRPRGRRCALFLRRRRRSAVSSWYRQAFDLWRIEGRPARAVELRCRTGGSPARMPGELGFAAAGHAGRQRACTAVVAGRNSLGSSAGGAQGSSMGGMVTVPRRPLSRVGVGPPACRGTGIRRTQLLRCSCTDWPLIRGLAGLSTAPASWNWQRALGFGFSSSDAGTPPWH